MREWIHGLFPAVVLCVLLTGCAAPSQAVPETTAAPETGAQLVGTIQPTEITAPTTEQTLPPETAPTETTEHVPTEPLDEHAPVLALPEVSEEPCHFYDDAAFMGDSISYTLFLYNGKTKDLGDATFLVRGSLGLHNTLNGQLEIYYKGKEMKPWDAVAASGVKKLFIMFGTNDIGAYGIEDTMEKWELFLEKIREKAPEVQIYIQSQTPMWTDANLPDLNNDNIDLYNVELEKFAEENGCEFVNIAPYFKDSTNGLAKKYCNDMYVHLNFEGTKAWIAALKEYAAQQENKGGVLS